jgi:hypothetical protein
MPCQCLCCIGILLAAVNVAPAQEQDFSKVEIRTTRLSESLYVLPGRGRPPAPSAVRPAATGVCGT